MSWIRMAVQSVNLVVLLLVCGIGFYNLKVSSQHSPSVSRKQDDRMGALTVVVNDADQEEQDDGVIVADSDEEMNNENSEQFIPTNDWQQIKPGQAIPRGLHVRLNMQTGEREARLLQDENGVEHSAPKDNGELKHNAPQDSGELKRNTPQDSSKLKHNAPQDSGELKHNAPQDSGELKRSAENIEVMGEEYTLDELKRAVKNMKSEKFRSLDMETLQKEKKFRTYEELKADMEKMNANIKTDAEVIAELVGEFRLVSHAGQDVTAILQQLEYYLHQIDNAMLFCDLGAMPMLLQCFNNSKENIRSEAALTLGSALQSNPKVQVSALENGAMHEVLRLLALDSSMVVRKRAMYALSTMIRHFPFAQKRFLDFGGLSVLGKLFEDKSAQNLQVRAVTLLADLVKEKKKHTEHSNFLDSMQKERLAQYEQVTLLEAMVENGWCALIPSLLNLPEHDSREKVLVAMETMLPVCEGAFQEAVPSLQSLKTEYRELLLHQEQTSDEEEEDSFYQGMVSMLEGLLAHLNTTRDEL